MGERHLTLAEVATQYRVSERWLRDFLRARDIPVLHTGRKIRFNDKALRALERALRLHPENAPSEAFAEALRRTAGPELPTTGLVYFAQAGDAGPIKIGKADDVVARLRYLQTGHSETIRLLGTMSGGKRRERELHETFAAHRVRGEWFAPAAALLDFIRKFADG